MNMMAALTGAAPEPLSFRKTRSRCQDHASGQPEQDSRVPRGAGTGLSGGAIAQKEAIVLSPGAHE